MVDQLSRIWRERCHSVFYSNSSCRTLHSVTRLVFIPDISQISSLGRLPIRTSVAPSRKRFCSSLLQKKNQCSIKEEILQQLAPEEKPVATTMLSRGMKRQLDFRPEAHQKRARSEEQSPSAASQLPSQGITPHIPGPLRPHEYQRLTDEMLKYYEDQQQRQDLYIRKMQLRDALYAVMKGVFPYCGLYVVGSSMNGFGAVNSDMDMCLMLSHCEIDQKREAREILRILFKSLKKCTFLKDLNFIAAKVPILKFADKISGVECDLNINNSVGIRNTHLLSAYSKLDWRVSLLVLFVKNWAKTQNINDASQGTISSYSLVLMVLHYLQCGCKPPVIPSLQQKYPHKFNPKLDIRLLTLNDKLPPYSSPNQQLLGELFTGFLNYYSNTFQYKTDVISVRLGGKLGREAAMMGNPTKNPRSQWKCLCIEEPFDLSNTARSVYDQMVFQRILRVIRLSYGRLRQSADVYSILNEPL